MDKQRDWACCMFDLGDQSIVSRLACPLAGPRRPSLPRTVGCSSAAVHTIIENRIPPEHPFPRLQ